MRLLYDVTRREAIQQPAHRLVSADQVDETVQADADGRRALLRSLAILAVTAALQAVVVVFSGSVALLGDTTTDSALTRPWTVMKSYRRDRNVQWTENNCTEGNMHVVIGEENYFISGDGYLMPARKGQQAPDLRYFRAAEKRTRN